MSKYNQQQAPPVFAPPSQITNPPLTQTYAAPPPAGYPTNDTVYAQQVPTKTTSRGDGFWKGCCAALCCCCMVDMCF
ncbi:protein CYSTEINE-RICH TRANSMEMBRANE MODULE 6-like isoform X2 [Carex rostrata]